MRDEYDIEKLNPRSNPYTKETNVEKVSSEIGESDGKKKKGDHVTTNKTPKVRSAEY